MLALAWCDWICCLIPLYKYSTLVSHHRKWLAFRLSLPHLKHGWTKRCMTGVFTVIYSAFLGSSTSLCIISGSYRLAQLFGHRVQKVGSSRELSQDPTGCRRDTIAKLIAINTSCSAQCRQKAPKSSSNLVLAHIKATATLL